MRHIEVTTLWLQSKVASGEIKVFKVGTKENRADNLTKYLDVQDVVTHNKWANLWLSNSRHSEAPEVGDIGQVAQSNNDGFQHDNYEKMCCQSEVMIKVGYIQKCKTLISGDQRVVQLGERVFKTNAEIGDVLDEWAMPRFSTHFN